MELNNEILSTVIFDPIRDEFYFAEKGKGSFQNDRRIRVSKRNKLKSCVFSIFDENTLDDKKSLKKIILKKLIFYLISLLLLSVHLVLQH